MIVEPVCVHTELELVLLPAVALNFQPPLAVNEHGDIPDRDVVHHIESDPPVVHAVRHHLGQGVVVGELAIVDKQHHRRRVR